MCKEQENNVPVVSTEPVNIAKGCPKRVDQKSKSTKTVAAWYINLLQLFEVPAAMFCIMIVTLSHCLHSGMYLKQLAGFWQTAPPPLPVGPGEACLLSGLEQPSHRWGWHLRAPSGRALEGDSA